MTPLELSPASQCVLAACWPVHPLDISQYSCSYFPRDNPTHFLYICFVSWKDLPLTVWPHVPVPVHWDSPRRRRGFELQVRDVLAHRHLVPCAWMWGSLPLLFFITGICCRLTPVMRKMKLARPVVEHMLSLAVGVNVRNQVLKELWNH